MCNKLENIPKLAPANAAYPLLPPLWYIFPVLALLAYLLSVYSLWLHIAIFYGITWTTSPFADWELVFMLTRRSLSRRYGNLPLRFNLVGLALISFMVFIRSPLETLLWYLDEILFPAYKNTTVKEPLILLGQPRSGTSKLQHTLAEDKETFCSVCLYEMRYPYLSVQYILDFLSNIDKRFFNGKGKQLLSQYGLLAVIPENIESLKKMRKIRLDLPDEDDIVFWFHSLCHHGLSGIFPDENIIGVFNAFENLSERTRRKYYNLHQKTVLKVMYRRGEGKQYLAKWVSCWTNGVLDQCKTLYPDAKYVVLVRDPKEQLPSWMKLQGHLAKELSENNFMTNIPLAKEKIIQLNINWYYKQIDFCKSTSKKDILVIRFTDFLDNISKQVGRIRDFTDRPILTGSSYDNYLCSENRKQIMHKKTTINTCDQFITEKRISCEFPNLLEEIEFSK